jgi:hypothetical protein
MLEFFALNCSQALWEQKKVFNIHQLFTFLFLSEYTRFELYCFLQSEELSVEFLFFFKIA